MLVWSVLSLSAVTLLVYTAAVNVWLLRAPCALPPPTETDDDPLVRLDLRLGRWDASRSYKLFDYAAVGDAYPEVSTRHVCLATQSSIERLNELLRTAAHWSGPISVAVYVTGDEFRLLRGFVTWLYHCRPEVYSMLAVHVAMPAGRPAKQGTMPVWARNCDDNPLPAGEIKTETLSYKSNHPYPQNHLRNLARKNCHSAYVFLVDIDIVPSKGMAEALDKFLSVAPKCRLCAYVVPTYELDKRVANFPENKSELIMLTKKKWALPFHKEFYTYNQNASNFSRWESTGDNESSETHISHDVTNFQLYYEPFYVALDNVPTHDERFLGYGFTKTTQVYEMFLIGYQFRVLSPIFTVHWGLQSEIPRPVWREEQIEKNKKKFQTFKRELYARYRKDPLHLLKRPPPRKA